jgi:ribose 5-phosphate isomerase B
MGNGRKIFIASDHNGNAARASIMKSILSPHVIMDLGPTEIDGKVDYPDYAAFVCRCVLMNPSSVGILICGTGTGMSIAANRFKGIRAGLATDRKTAELMREHNDANVLVLGQWRTSLDQMDTIVHTFLTTPFGGERHVARLEKLERLP